MAHTVSELARARLSEIETAEPSEIDQFMVTAGTTGPRPTLSLAHPNLPALELDLEEAEAIEWVLDFLETPLTLTSKHGGKLVRLIQRTTGLVIAIDGREINLSRPGATGLARLMRLRRRQASFTISRISP